MTGDVDPGAVIAALTARFGAWPQGAVVDPGPPPPEQAPAQRTIVVVDRPDLAQARIVVGHEGIARSDEDRIAVSIFNLIVGGSGFSSRLMAALRGNEEGLTYGASSSYSLRRAPGPFYASTFTRVEKARTALDVLLGELERARRDPPGEKELTWARTLATGSFAMGLETSDAVTASLVDLDVYGLPEDSLDTYRTRVRAVTEKDMKEVAQAHLHPERAAIVLVGPAKLSHRSSRVWARCKSSSRSLGSVGSRTATSTRSGTGADARSRRRARACGASAAARATRTIRPRC